MNSLPFYPLVWKTASGTFRGSVTWDMTLSVTLTLIVAIGFVLLLVLQWRDLRQRVSMPVRWGLCLLRAVAYLLVLGMLVNPSLLIQKVLQILPPLVVMMDTSGSMALSEPGKPTRLQQVKDYLHNGGHGALAATPPQQQTKKYQIYETKRPPP